MKKLRLQVVIIAVVIILNSCHDDFDQFWNEIDWHGNSDKNHSHSKQTKTYSSEVAFKWMEMQLRLVRLNPIGLGGTPSGRYFAYGAIALYESVVPGMPGYRSLSRQLNGMPALPETHHRRAYYWPASANAALAGLTRSFFTDATPANKASVDSLEAALNEEYQSMTDADELQRSIDFGKAVALFVYSWSTTDGASNANAPYTVPIGLGLWKPTPPGFGPPILPYWGNNRLMVSNSLIGTEPKAPPAYSEDPSSGFYKMAKEIYDLSQSLTPQQIDLANYYRGYPYGGVHYLSILKQILEKEDRPLDFTALVFAKTSIALIDANIACFKTKYIYNQMRPVTYIQEVLGYTSWNSVIATPPFPDFTSAHSVTAGAVVQTLEGFFGTNYPFTDHTMDNFGYGPLSYPSLDAMGKAISDSRVYGGIHYKLSCTAGLVQGRKVAKNIDKMVRFK